MTESSAQHAQFAQTWRSPRGFPAVLSEVNNRPIGMRFMVTATIFFIIGGIMALLMRIQLAVPENTFISPQFFNELFTMHGSTMMYLFAVPFLEGLAIYLLPLMIGSRDVAFPRLTAFSYWVYLFGGIIFYASFLFGGAPDTGWFAYPTLSGPGFAGIEQDFWLLGLAMVEIAGVGAGIEIVVTILKFRAPGMSINRMPLFAWTMLIMGFMIIIAFTVLIVATVLLELDRALGTQFFNPQRGGSTLLWQHLFWFFGHPDVYIMFLPATGIVSMVIPPLAKRPLAVYPLVVVAVVLTAFLSFGLWVHHMYTTGLPVLAMNFFAAASLMIGIASGIQVFAWIATMWGRPLRFRAALMFVLGFLFVFVFGGMTGVMIAVVPFDWQVHDTYFIVAHFHYVLIGGVIFPILAGLHYWIPKFTGRLLSETLGHWSFWLVFIGFNVTFFPMHIMGLLGMPRRVWTYLPVLEVGPYNVVATAGAFVLAAGFAVFAVNFWWSRRTGEQAGGDPWGGESLEWSVSSPPPDWSFFEPPVVRSRHPMWESSVSEHGLPARGRSHSESPEHGLPARGRSHSESPEHGLPARAKSQSEDSHGLEAHAPGMEGDPSRIGRRLGTPAHAPDARRDARPVVQAVEALTGGPADWRGTLVTDAVTAEPQAVQWLPRPTYLPLYTALGLLIACVGILLELYFVSASGAILTAGLILRWVWPAGRQVDRLRTSTVGEQAGLPIFTSGSRSIAWWAMVWFIVCLGMAAAALIYSYFFVRMLSDEWPQGDVGLPEVVWPGAATALLLLSIASQWLAKRAMQAGRLRWTHLWLGGAFVAGLVYLALLAFVLYDSGIAPQTNAYASFFHLLNWLAALYVLVGLALNLSLHRRLVIDGLEQRGYGPVHMEMTSLYWHFTVVTATAVYATVFLSPHLL